MNELEKKEFSKQIKVLIIEDNQVDRMILESMLTESPQSSSVVDVADSLSGGIKKLSSEDFDVLILDLNLPDSKGNDTLTLIIQKYPYLPIVINTGAYEEELGLHALNSGAQDFLVKGKYTAYILNKSLRYAIERKKLEKDLMRTNEKLKEAQDQLIQAEKMKVIGGLASGIAHEVRNPLATILYGVTYLSENVKVDDENYKTVLTNLKEATARADSIIKDLLDFSGLKKLNMVKENINVVIEKALVLVNHELQKKLIKVVKNLDLNIPEIELDTNRMQQVIINLILNSSFAMQDSGTITITSLLHELSEDLNEIPVLNRKDFSPRQKIVMLHVDDTGCGIPTENIDKIFDPFFTTRRAKGGVGLGLSVSQNIIENHGGFITVKNRSEGGVRATIILKA